MEFKDKLDLEKYHLYDEYPAHRFEFILRDMPDIFSRKDRTRFEYKRCVWDYYIHYGEYVAYRIGQIVGIPVCEVEIVKIQDEFHKEEGSISYYDLNQDEELITSEYILSKYAKKHGIDNVYLTDIPLVFNAFGEYFIENDRPEDDFDQFKRDLIDMTVFDLYLGNFDRTLQNWYLRRNKLDGYLDLYTLFDNEAILGFTIDDIDDFKSLDDYENYNNAVTSKIISPEDRKNNRRANYVELFEYLLESFPEETKNSIEKMKKLTYEGLKGILDEIPDLEDKRKEFALKNFTYRKVILDKIYENRANDKSKKKVKSKDLNEEIKNNDDNDFDR